MTEKSSIFGNGMFLGRYARGLDPQCRISLPSEWRSGTTEFVMVPTVGRAFLLLPVDMFQKFFETVSDQAIADVALQEAFAFLGSQSRFCRCDKQGRMALDRSKLEEAGIKDELVLSGAVTHIRITASGTMDVPQDDNSIGRYFDAIRKAKEAPGNALSGLFGLPSGNGGGK